MNQQFIEHTFGNGQSVRYRRLSYGTCCHADTPETEIAILEKSPPEPAQNQAVLQQHPNRAILAG